MEKDIKNPNRREFMKTGAVAGAGLVVGYFVPAGRGQGPVSNARAENAPAAPTPLAVDYGNNKLANAFVQISPDNVVTISCNNTEVGQGVFTSHAQMICDELECDWKQVKVKHSAIDAVFNNAAIPMMVTGASLSTRTNFEHHRRVGAMMREMLRSAAAKKWGVPVSECHAENGSVHHDKKGSATYGELADLAAKETPPNPKDVKLKDAKNYKFIGKSMPRVDAFDKSTGTGIFGMDVRVPGMLYACVARPPAGAKLKSVDDSAAKAVPGVKHVVRFGDSVGVAATNTYAAKKGRDALKIEWNRDETITSSKLMAQYKEMTKKPGVPCKKEGDAEKALKAAKTTIAAEYEFPFLAQAPMETMNVTIDFDGTKAHVWATAKLPQVDSGEMAKALGIGADKIELTMPYGGGSFGRRLNSDVAVEACEMAKALKKPIKLVWTREDDVKGGYGRPMNYHTIQVGLDDKGGISGWKQSIVGEPMYRDTFASGFMMPNDVDPSVVDGAINPPYPISDFFVDVHYPVRVIPQGLGWRSVAHTHTNFVLETMMDEIATATKKDPFVLRRELLKKAGKTRNLAVLDRLEKESGWGKKLPKGHALGMAMFEGYDSHVGYVAEVSVKNGEVRVHNVTAVVDCGLAINPEGARACIESGMTIGLSGVLYGDQNWESGTPKQSNFHDYKVVRMNVAPTIKVHFIQGAETPGGLGEPGVPPIGPAVANAIFKVTGKRMRKLPFSKELGKA